MINHLDY